MGAYVPRGVRVHRSVECRPDLLVQYSDSAFRLHSTPPARASGGKAIVGSRSYPVGERDVFLRFAFDGVKARAERATDQPSVALRSVHGFFGDVSALKCRHARRAP